MLGPQFLLLLSHFFSGFSFLSDFLGHLAVHSYLLIPLVEVSQTLKAYPEFRQHKLLLPSVSFSPFARPFFFLTKLGFFFFLHTKESSLPKEDVQFDNGASAKYHS